MNRFERRLVAIIDVLGLSDSLKDEAASRRYAQAVDKVLSPLMRRKDDFWLVLPHVRTGEEILIEPCLPATKGARTTTISDAILLSIPYGPRLAPEERSRRIFDCLHAVYGIQRSLLAVGLRTRGGMSVGGIIHKNHLVVGEGLVKAHRLESQIALMPRVVIDDAIITALLEQPMPQLVYFRNRVANLVRQDFDQRYYVDYLGVDPVIPGTRLHDLIPAIYRDIRRDMAETSDDRVRQKLGWMLNYFEAIKDDLADRSSRRTGHAGPEFSEVFYRSDETLSSYLKDVVGEAVAEGLRRTVG